MAWQEPAGEGHGGYDDSRQSDTSLGSSPRGSKLLPAGEEDERLLKSNARGKWSGTNCTELTLTLTILQCLSLVKEHRATSPENAGNLDQVKTDALQLRALISVVLMEVEEKCDSQTLDQVPGR